MDRVKVLCPACGSEMELRRERRNRRWWGRCPGCGLKQWHVKEDQLRFFERPTPTAGGGHLPPDQVRELERLRRERDKLAARVREWEQVAAEAAHRVEQLARERDEWKRAALEALRALEDRRRAW